MTDMTEEMQRKSPFSVSNIVTLIIGLLSIAVSIYIYQSSKTKAALNIEIQNPISYASSEKISGLEQFDIIVNGEKIKNLLAIPVIIENAGDEPISSVSNSSSYNLLDSLIIRISSLKEIKSYAVQKGIINQNLFSTSISNNTNVSSIGINLKSLNPGDRISFSILLSIEDEPQISLANNPLLGGNINLFINDERVEEKTFWTQFKRIYFVNIFSIIFLIQFPILLFYMLYQARLTYLDNKDDKDDSMSLYDEREKRIDAELEQYISELLTANEKTETLKDIFFEIPSDSFHGKSNAMLNVYEMTKITLRDKWRYSIGENHPYPDSKSTKIYSPTWYFWDDYTKAAIWLFLISGSLFTLGYFMYFY